MANEEIDNNIEEVENEVEETGSGAPKTLVELFETHKQKIAIGGGVLALLIVGLLYFFLQHLPAQELKAQDEVYMAQFAFNADSFALALNGRSTPGTIPFKGFLQIADEYGMTKTGNTARYCAGVCYLRLKKFAEAAEQLKKSSPSDQVVGAVRLNAIGDALAGAGNMEEAISYYAKAADYSANETYTPYYLLKTGLANEKQGNKEAALKYYQKIKDKYPNSDEGREIQKYITRVGG